MKDRKVCRITIELPSGDKFIIESQSGNWEIDFAPRHTDCDIVCTFAMKDVIVAWCNGEK